jgi:16S rRNA (uracil1498-N3)-methyltransferase
MRAIWIKDLNIQNEYILTDAPHHHLVHVVRSKLLDRILLLDGQGLMIEVIIKDISKRHVILEFQNSQLQHQQIKFDLALGMPKKEALEICLKQATEIGFKRVMLVQSEFSQSRFPDSERIHQLLVSALEQSNCPFIPEIVCTHWEKINWESYHRVILLDSQKGSPGAGGISTSESQLLVVGPEGGFSPKELEYFSHLKNLNRINLPTGILRTPTAVAVGAGMIIEGLRNNF